MSHRIAILFLCTHNSARSILAEAILNHIGDGRFIAFSAGSEPRASGRPNPLALQVLREAGIATDGLRSKSWDEFLRPDTPAIDLVITVCGNADEICPVFPGRPATAHWGFEDPSAGDAPEEQKLHAFRHTLVQVRHRLDSFVSLPDAALERLALQQAARDLVPPSAQRD